ncbi:MULTISPECIES: carbohydrate ABC transporter permease [Paenibacillus]|uniref:Carbohydrate ABC transporter permease n=1 Tax=Paenibacillus lignilyticus TaxID=1172615 RepID=A0ABS5CL65_9BACL|nr:MULTISPECIES: carbohydrate ABC transporter permease [Paenibacillus]MBP3966565.1 carbohydrate ABC transporter permease [Paenibacillus lignilyticus]SFT27719.1 putative aldouronate transport system permease protein [Paenibacillus sp. BC26]
MQQTYASGTNEKTHKKIEGTYLIFNIISYSVVIVAVILCLLPFEMLVSGSFTSESAITQHGYGIIPAEFSLEAYRVLFKYPQDILRAYGVSIFITVVGTAVGLFVTSMTAYVLNRKDFLYRNKLAFFFYFTTLFNGGILSLYIFFVKYLHLKNSLLSLIIPLIINVFYLIVMRTFISSIPDSISESAKIDGAGDFTIFLKLILPLTKPGLATIGLFYALEYWNDWYNAMLFITDIKLYPLQYLLFSTLQSSEAIARLSSVASVSMIDVPTLSLKLAMAVIATGPIILVYPYVQKYFVKGLTVGAIKG